MALQDLTPQLRTRLSRMERAVGWFVLLALGLLGFGFVYYAYNTAERKGWFLTKGPYFVFVQNATGLKVGDPVKLMGFDAGVIRRIVPMPADDFQNNVYVEFELKDPNFGYVWTEGSKVRVATADFLGKRVLEVLRGTGGYPTYLLHPVRRVRAEDVANLPEIAKWELGQEINESAGTNLLAQPQEPVSKALPAITAEKLEWVTVIDKRLPARKAIMAMWNFKAGHYEPFTNNVSSYWLLAEESPAVTERLEQVFNQVQQALPGIFHLTNQLGGVLSNTAVLTSNLNELAVKAVPVASNLAAATADLDKPGALGDWLIPTNLNSRLDTTLGSAGSTMQATTTNLAILSENLNRSLLNLATITSNLNEQVHANTNILSSISETITHADQFVQGLKRHWLLRSAFKSDASTSRTNRPSQSTPLKSPKERSR